MFPGNSSQYIGRAPQLCRFRPIHSILIKTRQASSADTSGMATSATTAATYRGHHGHHYLPNHLDAASRPALTRASWENGRPQQRAAGPSPSRDQSDWGYNMRGVIDREKVACSSRMSRHDVGVRPNEMSYLN